MANSLWTKLLTANRCIIGWIAYWILETQMSSIKVIKSQSRQNPAGINIVDPSKEEIIKFPHHKDRSLNSQRISFLSLVKNCNHKGLGIYYLLSAFIFGISGTLISVLMRIELYSSGNRIISPENQNFYNISITLHGFLMIFFLVMPGLKGNSIVYFLRSIFRHFLILIFNGSS